MNGLMIKDLQGLICRFRKLFGWGCATCGTVDHGFSYAYEDKEYCADCWPGYDHCASLGCHHYRCEHSVGETWKKVYVKPGLPGKVGDETYVPAGCMNAGCTCKGFSTRAEVDAQLSEITRAAKEAFWKFCDIPGVLDVESEVFVSIPVQIILNEPDAPTREVVFQLQDRLREKYPNAPFVFNVISTNGDNTNHE